MTSMLEEVSALLRFCKDAVNNGVISPTQANKISCCANDFTHLESLRLRQHKKSGADSAPEVAELPDLRPVRELLYSGDYASAVKKARQIRVAMKPILVAVRKQFKVSVAEGNEP